MPKMTSSSPSVATNSPSHRPPEERVCVDRLTASRSNMRLATIAPTHPPMICATTYTAAAARRDAAEQPVGQRHDRVEVRARHRTEREDQSDQARAGRGRVLQQLQPDVVRRQPLRVDARPDDDRDEERRADRLRPPPGEPGCGRSSAAPRGRLGRGRAAHARRRPGSTVRSSPGGISTSASTV